MKSISVISLMVLVVSYACLAFSSEIALDFTMSEARIQRKLSKTIKFGMPVKNAKATLVSYGFKCYKVKDNPCVVSTEWTACNSKLGDQVILTCFRLPQNKKEQPLRWQVSAIIADKMYLNEVYIHPNMSLKH